MDPQDLNLQGFYSLGQDINKAKGRDGNTDTAEGLVTEPLPELTLSMDNEKLSKLFAKYEKRWTNSTVKTEWEKQSKDNEKYWKGKQYNKVETSTTETVRPLVDNEIFQAVETYLPAATRQNPEPLVELRATEQKTDAAQQFATILRDRLSDWSDDVRLRLKLKKAGRHWLLSLVGIAKMGWDTLNNRPAVKVIRPQKLILDPDGVTDEDGYSGKFIGEYRKMEASTLLSILEEQKGEQEGIDKINELTKDELGSDVQFIEWWTPDYMCWIIDDKVMLKKQNPHWNYSAEEVAKNHEDNAPKATATTVTADPVTSTETGDMPTELGERNDAPATEPTPIAQSTPAPATATDPNAPATTLPTVPQLPVPSQPQTATAQTAIGPVRNENNHFPSRRMPYVFLSIFNLGATPVDVTSLITQNLPQQDLINKRLRQIDKNADGMNGGVIVSEERSGLTKDEAKNVTDALRRGGTVIIPAGSPQDAVFRLPSVPLPPDVFAQLADTRNRMYDIFGIRGITPSGIKNETTVRGKIITKGLDTDRIGGGITEYFEQFADEIYNWVAQLLYVYDDIFQANPGAKLPKLKITVKEGSLLPKDATSKANQAIDLCNGGKMSVIDMYKALEYANPEEMAANLWLEANAPELLFKDNPMVMQAIQMKQQQAQAQAQAAAQAKGGGAKGPSESINFKDLPPEGKAQMAKQAGIELAPDTIAAHEMATHIIGKLPAVPTAGGRPLPANASK